MNEEIKEILAYILSLTYGNESAIKGANKILNYITNLQEKNQKLINGIDEINECMKKYEKTSVDDAKTIIAFYKQLKNILNKLAELKKGE